MGGGATDYDPSKPLTNPRHERLAQTIASTGDREKALEAGGFSTSCVGRNYTRLLGDNPPLVARIEWLSAQIAASTVAMTAKQQSVSRDEVIGVYRKVIREAQAASKDGRIDWSAVCKAAEGLGRSIGMFTERKIVESEHPHFEQMTTEQLRAALVQAASLMDPNELRAFLGSNAGPDRSASVDQQEQDPSVPAVSETSGVPSTRH